jgi:plasmid stabilization system protein ParE
MDKLLVAEAAEEEYTDSLRWYAERSVGAAEGFEATFEQALESIAAHPERYPLCDDRHRFFLLKRYPFQIIYRKTSEDRWLVVAVWLTPAWTPPRLLGQPIGREIAERLLNFFGGVAPSSSCRYPLQLKHLRHDWRLWFGRRSQKIDRGQFLAGQHRASEERAEAPNPRPSSQVKARPGPCWV